MEAIPAAAREVLGRLTEGGYEAYLVGGCVRDLLLGRTPGDWDMTTSALPEATMALFAGHAVPTGLRHGTVTVRAGGASFEVTTYRVDGAYGDHRRPDTVRFTSSLTEDLGRRDFTVNAMAMDAGGTLVDPFDGQRDLKNRLLRCAGVPERRLEEDALRIMRALRFSAVLGFEIEAETDQAVHHMAAALEDIAAERLREELLKMLCGADAVRVLLEYPDVLGVFLPELLPAVGLDQRNRHHCYTVWEHTARSVGHIPPEPVLRMTMLLHDLGKPACMTVDEAGEGHFKGHAGVSHSLAKQILTRLRFDNDSAAQIEKLVKWHDAPIEPAERAMRRALNKMGAEGVRALLAVKRADNLAQAPAYLGRQQEIDALEALLAQVLARDDCFSLRQLAVDGHDLVALGYQGREIGQKLRWLLDAVVDGRLENEREGLLAALRGGEEEVK